MKPSAARVLDPQSRQVLVRLAAEIVWFGAFAALPALAGRGTLLQTIGALGSCCSFAALLRAVIALYRRVRIGGPVLNDWDECLALVGAATIASGIVRLLSGV